VYAINGLEVLSNFPDDLLTEYVSATFALGWLVDWGQSPGLGFVGFDNR